MTMCSHHEDTIDEAEEIATPSKRSIPCLIAIALIRFYQLALRPHLAGCCRFVPSCSAYGMEAFRKYGFLKGFKLTAKRIARCRPGGPYGYDPVP